MIFLLYYTAINLHYLLWELSTIISVEIYNHNSMEFGDNMEVANLLEKGSHI